MKKDLILQHNDYIVKIVNDMYDKEEISTKTRDYLVSSGQRTAVFYLLPKIHKKLKDLPGRPIVSSSDSPTEKISQLLDIILQEYVLQTCSYIKDTTDFIQKISTILVKPGDILFTMDIVGLYTNIPHDKGIEAIQYHIRNRKANPPNDRLIQLLNIVLKFNNFKFTNKHFLQVNGTAVGTHVASTYANLFVSHFEDKFVYPHRLKPLFWFRFIDDIWGVFRGTQETLSKFHQDINNAIDSINFTLDSSEKSVVFLDVTTYVHKDKIHTCL